MFGGAYYTLMLKWLDVTQAMDLCGCIRSLVHHGRAAQYPNIQSVWSIQSASLVRNKLEVLKLRISIIVSTLGLSQEIRE